MDPITPLLVSVIIPAYNAESFLEDAVRSVLDQTWRELEVIVVDDGSTDATGSIAERIGAGDGRVLIIHRENGGLSSARNAGMAAASGDAFCFLDADDVLLPDKIRNQAEFLRSAPTCDLVYSDYYVGDRDLTPMWLECVRPATQKMDEYLIYRNRFAPLCPMLRSRLVAATGLFDETLRGGEDWDYWIRAAQVGSFSYLPGPAGIYRVHPNQLHHDHELMTSSDRQVARKNFARGSRKWRMSLAARAWAEGREAWWDRKFLLIPIRIAQAALIARSPRILRDVIRWA